MDIASLTQDQLKTDLPAFNVGDTIRVHAKIKEGDKERIQVFEGVVIKKARAKSIDANFTVRRIASSVGVERTFYMHSPNVAKIEPVREGKIRRAKLYYLRNLRSKTINIKGKRADESKAAKAAVRAENVKATEAPAAEAEATPVTEE